MNGYLMPVRALNNYLYINPYIIVLIIPYNTLVKVYLFETLSGAPLMHQCEYVLIDSQHQ